ncbi:UDP-N-acetylmuramyl-tripeptide synthetase [Candidatus Dojkabacteria bacterium]|uniref:UDP-N-acetylmuramyl-tripeptide synthetase n=1 Tax=Candidatus Dojkabacteria bacterium TaxID=2099670 RepID=A0A955L1P3_9BACT|nr:UDP-N-acetylmuramyl-tripeptide synthetase [Candidatus Dojkabacteria bacterium]
MKNSLVMFLKLVIPESLRKQWRYFLSFLGAVRYGFPARKLKLIGVTGTSGKSTTTAMIYHLLSESGLEVGMISTVGAKAGKKVLETGLHVTTPDPYELQKILAFMVKRKMEYVVIEASSHALAQGRLGKIEFEVSVFTNIKKDHLDWHKTWENYAKSKAILAKKTKPDGKIIVNREDKEMYKFLSDYLGDTYSDRFITYSFNEILNISESGGYINFRLDDTNFSLPMLGMYNVENALAAINVAQVLGIDPKESSKALKTFPGIKGRMQIMQREPFFVIVDFAHNNDSLIKSLQSANKLKSGLGKVITVFGSAGLRDVQKRYEMGETGTKYADVVIVTAEDPRVESLKEINDQIIKGAEKSGANLIQRFKDHEEFENYKVDKQKVNRGDLFVFDQEDVQNRYDAIEFAFKIANEGDVIITEGKGHEQSLCFGETEYPFTDQEAVRRAISALGLDKAE